MINITFNRLHKIATVVLVALMLALITVPVHAEGPNTDKTANGAYEVVRYDFNAVVDKAHSYAVTENITVNLPGDLERIEFAIPDGNFRVSGLKVEDAAYEKAGNDTTNSVAIVDSALLTKGTHTYKIEYVIREFADRDPGRDILYFDALIPGWMQPITDLNISVQLPEDFPWDDLQYYAGQFGVQDVNTKLDYNADQASHTVTIRGSRIPENFGITLKAQLPDGYWQGMLDGTWALRLMMVVAAAAAVLMLILWLIGGRDPRFAKTLQSHPVEGITPVEMGYIFIGRIRIRDIIALILYLGAKGCLKISEYAPKRFTLIRKEEPLDEEKFIRNAYDILFEDVPEDRGIDIMDALPKLRRIKKTIEADVAAGFSSKDMLAYTPLSRGFRIAGAIILAFAAAITCGLRYSYVYTAVNSFESAVVGLLLIAILILLCRQFDRYYYAEQRDFTRRLILLAAAYTAIPVYIAVMTISLTGKWIPAILSALLLELGGFLVVIMRARAKGNAALAHKFMGLRHFIYHPTPEEMAKNVHEDKNYYYEIVPYAYLFNGLDAWAISFLTLNVPEPEWYSDDIEGHAITNLRKQISVVDYARDIKAFGRTVESAYRARSSRGNRKLDQRNEQWETNRKS